MAYEHIRYIHLPVNFTMASLKMEDWNVLGGKMTPQDFEGLMRQLSGLDHTVEPLVYEEPAMCCPKPLAERANPNP